VKRLRLVLLSTAALLAGACSSVVDISNPEAGPNKAAHINPQALEKTARNAFFCSAVDYRTRQTSPHILKLREVEQVASDPSNTEWTGFAYLVVSKKGNPILNVSCVVPRQEGVDTRMKAALISRFLQDNGKRDRATMSWAGSSIACSIYGGSASCDEGVQCGQDAMRKNKRRANFSYMYCDNGCTIDIGNMTFDCPDAAHGDVDGGGGGSGGSGGYTEETGYPCMAFDLNWNLCKKKPSTLDSARARTAIYSVSLLANADTVCATIRANARAIFDTPSSYDKFRLGRSGFPATTPAEWPEHVAEWDGAYIHVDEDFFNGAGAKAVAATIMHEMAHKLGYRHDHGFDSNNNYVDYPFSLIWVT
jgi:hypothetical protein